MTSLHTTEDLAFYLLAVTNAGSFFGRISPLVLGNVVGPIQSLMLWSGVGAVMLFVWISIRNIPGFIVFCVIWGFVSGVLVTAPPAAVAHRALSPSLDVIGTRLGMSWMSSGIGVLVGTPIAGALVDVNAVHYVHAQVFGGVVMVAGILCLLWPMIVVMKYKSSPTS